MSSKFITTSSTDEIIKLLNDGTQTLNVAQIIDQSVAANLPVCGDAMKKLIGRQLVPGDLSFGFISNPLSSDLNANSHNITNVVSLSGTVNTRNANDIVSDTGTFTNGNVVTGNTGKTIQDSGTALSSLATTASLSNYLPLAGGTMSGAIAMGTNNITNLGSLTANSNIIISSSNINDDVEIGNTVSTLGSSNSVAIGNGVTILGTTQIAIGKGANTGASTTFDVAIGRNCQAIGGATVALGQTASTNVSGAIAIGSTATCDGKNSISIGTSSVCNGTSVSDQVAIGHSSSNSANGGVAIGANSATSASNAIAIGEGTSSSGTNSVCIGQGAIASAIAAISLGAGANNSVANSCLIGDNTNINIRPNNDATCDLGTTTSRFNNLYLAGVLDNTATLNVGTVSATTVNLGRNAALMNILGAPLGIDSTGVITIGPNTATNVFLGRSGQPVNALGNFVTGVSNASWYCTTSYAPSFTLNTNRLVPPVTSSSNFLTDFTFASGVLTYTGTRTRTFRISYNITINSPSTNNVTVTFWNSINASTTLGSTQSRTPIRVTTTNADFGGCVTDLITLNTNDTIQLAAVSTLTTSTLTITFVGATIQSLLN